MESGAYFTLCPGQRVVPRQPLVKKETAAFSDDFHWSGHIDSGLMY